MLPSLPKQTRQTPPSERWWLVVALLAVAAIATYHYALRETSPRIETIP